MSTLQEAYELTGHGKFNILALITSGFLLLNATVESLGLGYVLNKADCDLQVDTSRHGTLSASTLIGVVTSAVLWGVLADTYGRRKVMLPATVVAVVCSILSSFSIGFKTLFVFRIITGVMMSASCATAYVYLGELTTPSRRSEFIAWGSAFISGSYIVMPVSSWILLPRKFSVHVAGRLNIVSWRVLMWAYTIWGTAACVGLAILPESPSFALSKYGAPAALAILARMYSWNHNKPPDEFPIKELEPPHACHRSFKETLFHMKHMIRPPLLRCVLISHTCNFMVFMQSNSFYVWMPHIVDEMLQLGDMFKGMGMCAIMNEMHAGLETIVMDVCVPEHVDSRVYPIATVLGLLLACVYVAVGAGTRRWGKLKVYNFVMIVCALFMLVATVVPHATWGIVLFVPGLCGITASTVLAGGIVEVFPTSLRALAMCTMFMVGRLGAALGTDLVAWALQHSCLPVAIFIVVITAASGALLFLWPDSDKVRAEMEAMDFNY